MARESAALVLRSYPSANSLDWFVASERLKDEIGIVTGADSGIGRACAIARASEARGQR